MNELLGSFFRNIRERFTDCRMIRWIFGNGSFTNEFHLIFLREERIICKHLNNENSSKFPITFDENYTRQNHLQKTRRQRT